MTNRESYENIKNWLKECHDSCPKTVVLVLVGNKADLYDKREVQESEALQFAMENQLLFIETSALTGFNIDDLFFMASKKVKEDVDKGVFELKDESCGIKLGKKSNYSVINESDMQEKRKKKCCKA